VAAINSELTRLVARHCAYPDRREAIERQIARVHRAALGLDPATRNRLGVYRRLDWLASGGSGAPPLDVLLCGGAEDKIPDEELRPLAATWTTMSAGAKRDGGVGKYRALSRLFLKRLGQRVSPETIEREARTQRRELEAREGVRR
jgi:hypothetical protein